jgi:hypothetical protein
MNLKINIKKKGQITLFIILGIVLVFILSMTMYFKNNYITSKSENVQATSKTVLDEKEKLDFFIRSCIEDASDTAFKLAGHQSGLIYNYQFNGIGGYFYRGKGNISNPTVYPYEDKAMPFFVRLKNGGVEGYNVSYLIPSRIDDSYSSTDIDYPLGVYVGRYPFGHSSLYQFSKLLPLGLKNQTETEQKYGVSLQSRFTANGNSVIQNYLETHILENVKSCINQSIVSSRLNMVLTLKDLNKTKIKILFGENDLYVRFHNEIKVNYLSIDNLETKLDVYEVRLPIRFKKIYELAYYILENDAKDPYFNKKNIMESSLSGCQDYVNGRWSDTDCLRDGMNVTVIHKACEYSSSFNDTVDSYCNESFGGDTATFIIIEDNKSLAINNEPYKFVMLVGNRPPILEEITYKNYNSSHSYYVYLNSVYSSFANSELFISNATPRNLYLNSRAIAFDDDPYDVIVDYDKKLCLFPRALDPDEDYYHDSYSFVDSKGSSDRYYYFSSSFRYDNFIVSNAYTSGLASDLGWANIKNKDVCIDNINKSDLGNQTIKYMVKDLAGNIATQEVDIQVRCYDKLRGFDSTESKSVNFNERWNNGNYYSSQNIWIYGDYNFSVLSYDDLDINDSNDCCNESSNFLFSDDGHKCDTCHRCVFGDCLINRTKGNIDDDCGPCKSCDDTGNCVIDDGNLDKCEVEFPGEALCCGGKCINKSIAGNSISSIAHTSGFNHINIFADLFNNDCWEAPPYPDVGFCINNTDIINKYPDLKYKWVSHKPTNDNCGPNGYSCDLGECKN